MGDWAGRVVAQNQPIKLAAFEGVGHTEHGADEHLLGYYEHGRVRFGIPVPDLLSLLAFHNPHAVVRGLDTVPADDRPPVNVVRFAFQTMGNVSIDFFIRVLDRWAMTAKEHRQIRQRPHALQ